MKKSIEYLFVLIMPVMVMCFVCGDCIVGILYGRGNFDSSAVATTTSVVIGYAVGFLFQATRANLVRVYYAFQNTKTPMINGAISVGVNVTLSILLSKVIGICGIALATSISMLVVTVLLLPGVKRYIPGFSLGSSLSEYVKVAGIAIGIGCAAYLLRRLLPFGAIVTFFVVGGFTVLSYVGAAYLMKIQAINVIVRIIMSRLKHR